MAISSVQSQFISLFCETCFYGIYSMLFLVLVIHFRQKAATSRAISVIRVITVLQYCMDTVHIALAFYQNYVAFTVSDDAAEAFNRLGAAPYTLAQLGIEWANCACADSILIWRVWMLWNHRIYTIILPIILVILSTVSGYLVVWSMSVANRPASSDFGDLFSPTVEKWAIMLAVCIILTNIICTGMIAGRIWWHNRELQKVTGIQGMPHRHRVILFAILESGAVYLFVWVIAVFLYLVNETAIIPMLDIISQLSGIVPALIVILVSRSIDAVTHHEEALTTMRYRPDSRVPDRDARITEMNSFGMIPVHWTNSFETQVSTGEKMTFADNTSFENIIDKTNATGTTLSVTGSGMTMAGSSREENAEEIV